MFRCITSYSLWANFSGYLRQINQLGNVKISSAQGDEVVKDCKLRGQGFNFRALGNSLPYSRSGLHILRSFRRLIKSLSSRNKIHSYLVSHEIRKLQIGSGHNYIDGWLNTDYSLIDRRMIFMDASKQFKIPDNSFDYVFAEYQIEQLDYKNGLKMLSECHRILKSGGKIRIATTNLEALLTLYRDGNSDSKQAYIKWIMDMCFPGETLYSPNFVLNNAFYNWDHRFLYDQATLRMALEESGFDKIVICEIGQSDDLFLKGVESHSNIVGNEDMCRFEILILEAVNR